MPIPLSHTEIAIGLCLARDRWQTRTYKHNTPWTGINEAARKRNLDGATKLLEGFERWNKFTDDQIKWAKKLLTNAQITRKDIASYMSQQLPKGVQAQETGHSSMLDRVKAMRTLIDALEENINAGGAGYGNSMGFYYNMREKFDLYPDEELEISAKQYFWAKDLYDKHCL